MKTAEQWMEEINHEASFGEPSTPLIDRIREIQNDAIINYESKIAIHEVLLNKVIATIEHLRNPELGDDAEYRDSQFDDLLEAINQIRPK